MRKSVLTLMAVSGLLLGFFSSSTSAEDPIRIMPLGDSITRGWYGSPGANGYRKPLYLNLINHGYNVDFVGGQNDGDFADRNHEGRDGWHASGGTGGGEFVNDVSILWFADSHYCDREPDGRYYRQVLTHKLPAAINQALIDNCDFAACSGDFSEFEYSNGEGTLDNLSALLSAVEAYMPCAVAVGNHDIPYATKPAWISRYDRDFDRDNSRAHFSFSVKGRHFVFLDAMFDANGGNYGGVWNDTYKYYIPTAEQIWLENDLAAHSSERTFVFIHQRIDVDDYLIGGAHAGVMNSAEVRAILETAGNVEAVFQGHVHKSAHSLINGIHYYTIMSMVDGDCEANPNNNAYAIINITENGVFTITPYRNADNQNSWDIKTFQLGGNVGLLPNVYNWLVANPADIVLLHIGTNDITYGDQDVNEVNGILNEIDRYSTDITVILARIINRQPYNQVTTQYNNSLNQMALNRIANGDDIIIVDMESALNYSTDMADNLHPNDSGYSKMADVWFTALDNLLKETPPSITSSPKTSAILQQLYTYDVNAAGDPPPNYELVTHPDGMTIDANTGLIEWMPAAAGDFDVTVKACNGATPDATQNFTITVLSVIEFDAASSANIQNNNIISWPHTIGTGSNRLLVVGVFGKDSNSANLEIGSVKYNNIAMKLVDGSGKSAGDASLIKTELYYLLDENLPPSGSYNIVITYPGSVAEISAGAVSLKNVHQQPREAVAAGSQSSSNSIATNITTFAGGAWVVDIVGCDSAGTFSHADTNMTERWSETSAGTSAAASTRPAEQPGEVTIGWSNSSAANQIVHSAAAFTPIGCTISGQISEFDGLPISNAQLFTDPNGSSAIADPNGYYKVWVPYGWSGVVTPAKTECVFDPVKKTYSNITADSLNQDYKNVKKYDLDKNGTVNSGDLAIIYENWLDTGPGIECDLNNDNIVNFLDYTEFTEVCYSP